MNLKRLGSSDVQHFGLRDDPCGSITLLPDRIHHQGGMTANKLFGLLTFHPVDRRPPHSLKTIIQGGCIDIFDALGALIERTDLHEMRS